MKMRTRSGKQLSTNMQDTRLKRFLGWIIKWIYPIFNETWFHSIQIVVFIVLIPIFFGLVGQIQVYMSSFYVIWGFVALMAMYSVEWYEKLKNEKIQRIRIFQREQLALPNPHSASRLCSECDLIKVCNCNRKPELLSESKHRENPNERIQWTVDRLEAPETRKVPTHNSQVDEASVQYKNVNCIGSTICLLGRSWISNIQSFICRLYHALLVYLDNLYDRDKQVRRLVWEII